MTLPGDTSALAFDLSKVPSPEATPKLQALTLSLAERVYNLEKRLAGRIYVGTCTLTQGPAFAYPPGTEWGACGFLPAAEEIATSPRKNTHPAGPQLFLPGKRQAWHVGWDWSFSGTASPDASCSRICQCRQSSFWSGFFWVQDFPDLIFPQNLITREAALDLGSGDGVQGSLSSTLASKGTCHMSSLPGSLPFPPCSTFSCLLVRNQLVV